MIITNQKVCHEGYGGTDTRPPQDGDSRPMNVDARCDEPATESNARGAQNAPRARRVVRRLAGRGVVRPGDRQAHLGRPDRDGAAGLSSTGTVAPPTLGEESWKWLFLQPLTQRSGVTEETSVPLQDMPSAPPRTPCG